MTARTAVVTAAVSAVLLGAASLPTRAAQPAAFDALFSFGDSLSDTGNIFAGTAFLGEVPAVPPSESPHRTYYNGRFSNGPVAVEYLWELLSGAAPDSSRALQPILTALAPGRIKALDFAFGGTGTPYLDITPGGESAPGLLGQVELFRFSVRSRGPMSRTLFVIATGANDYRVDAFNVPMDPSAVVGNIIEAITRLYGLGARTVMVYDVPDPAFLPGGDPTGVGSAIAALHNLLLAQGLAELGAQHSDLRLIPVHINELFPDLENLGFEMTTPALDALFPNPASWPFGVPTSLCLFVFPGACQDVNFDVAGQLGRPYVFWDVVHPTTDAHRFLGEFLYASLTE